ncbi:hypothetical protein ACS0TY_004074 [Phlomoides rotata]
MSEVIVKIDGGDQPATIPTTSNRPTHRRESSLDIWRDEVNTEDPPSKLIGQFLNKQRAAGGEFCLDVDLEMEELRQDRSNHSLPPLSGQKSGDCTSKKYYSYPASRELKFPSKGVNSSTGIGPDDQERIWQKDDSSSSSEEDNGSVINRKPSMNKMSNVDLHSTGNGCGDGQVVRCSSIQRRFSGLGRLKTRSRLMDPPDVPDRRSGMLKSGQMQSQMLGRASGMLGKPPDEDDDDPFFDEDLPEEYKKAKFDALTIAQWISLVLIVTALVCTMTIGAWKVKKLRGLHLWKWEVLILVLICGRLVSGWGIRIVVFFVERNFFMRKRVLYFVYGIRKAVQNCIWLGLVLIAWHSMFDQEVEGNIKFLWYVNKLMVCMLVGTLLWLVKTLMVKVLASSFHVSTFFDRIQENLFNQYVIEALSGPPQIEMRKIQEEEDRTMAEVWRLQNAGATLPPDLQPTKSGKVGPGLPPRSAKTVSFKFPRQASSSKGQDDQTISIDQLHKLNHKNVSAWNMKRLIKTVKNGVLTTLDEQALDSTQGGDENATQIRSECEAKFAARKIFRNVAKPRAKFIYPDDLMRFLPDEEALKTLNIVEGSTENEKISKASLKSWVVNAFIERRALALTLNDTKTAVDKLHHMVNVIVGTIIFVICLVILEIATSKFLLYISSQVVVVAFVFGNTCKTVFEAIVFVFVMHPFDVGDRCEVDGVQMVVEEMNILTTVFLRYDNQKIFYPNVTLATRPINNYYRSPDMGDSVDFDVHIATPLEKIAIIKQKIISYIENKSDYWYHEPSVVLMNLEHLNTMKLSVWMRHRMNHQNMGERWKRRALLVEEMVKIFKEMDIEYRLYPLDINLKAMPPINSTRMPPAWSPTTAT